jgi:hypothetical protein
MKSPFWQTLKATICSIIALFPEVTLIFRLQLRGVLLLHAALPPAVMNYIFADR